MAEGVSKTIMLPWTRERGENARFVVILALLATLFGPAAVLIPQVELPQPTEETLEAVPAHLAQLVNAPKPKPKVVAKPLVPPVKPKPKPKPKAPPKPVEKPKKLAKPKVKPRPPVEKRANSKTPKTSPKAQPGESANQAREVARKSGLLALQSQLTQMQDLASPAGLPATITTMGKVDTDSAPSKGDQPLVSESSATRGSGGIAKSAAPQQRVALADRRAQHLAPPAHQEHPRANGESADKGERERGMRNIRKVFDRNKSALFILYNMALRQNPLLQGKVLLELVIQPDGSVSSCKVVSSELHDKTLEKQIVERVELFNFGRRDVKQRKVRIPINFLPP